MNLLHIDAGITPGSVTRQISAAVVGELTRQDPSAHVTHRDLESAPVPHLDQAGLATLAQNDALDEFLAADVIVIGAPMYNFGIASQLKAWLDRILVAGRTFRYTETGPEGLAKGKRVIIASSRGGAYPEGSPMRALDFQEPYLTAVLHFIGIDDITFVRAEGVAIGPEQRATALAGALAAVPALVGEARALAA